MRWKKDRDEERYSSEAPKGAPAVCFTVYKYREGVGWEAEMMLGTETVDLGYCSTSEEAKAAVEVFAVKLKATLTLMGVG
jgi:hypothetical protein